MHARASHRILVGLIVAALAAQSLASVGYAAPTPLRQRVMANLAQSQKARNASQFHRHLRRELTRAPRRVHTEPGPFSLGPRDLPHGAVVMGDGPQPAVRIDKTDRRIKRLLRKKAARLRQDGTLTPWKKIEAIQKLIRDQVRHSGNELDPKKNPNAYTRYTRAKHDAGKPARLGDYLAMGQVVCREMGLLTQVALEDAGFTARLAGGNLYRGGVKVGEHAWNEVKLDGKWHIVDTTNPQFNRTDPKVAAERGTANGWVWQPIIDYPMLDFGEVQRARR